MFIFGHLGMGWKITQPWGRRLSVPLILLGTLLPDLIDKPLYYGLSWITGKSGAALGIIAGTRSFGHTAVFLILLTLIAWVFKNRGLAALCLGIASHLVLDNVGDRIYLGEVFTPRVLLWPLIGWDFPPFPFRSLGHHLDHLLDPYFFVTEAIGAGILIWEYRIRRQLL